MRHLGWPTLFLVLMSLRAEAELMAETPLPPPRTEGAHSVEALLARRRSVRDFGATPLNLEQVGQLAWAAQGITDTRGLRAAPSAGALYPLELYLVAGRVEGLEPGVYLYRPRGHLLEQTTEGDRRTQLATAALGQAWLAEAPAVFVIAAICERTAVKYGARAPRYVQIEVGHAAQNLFLQATALGLGTVVVGAFRDEQVARVLALPPPTKPIALMPLGTPEADRQR
jgi:SagB-type dehydrogenase family enzyme